MTQDRLEGKTLFFCDLGSMDPATRKQHAAITRELFAEVISIEELVNGYAFRLPDGNASLTRAAAFIVHEKECCPFFEFTLVIKPESGPTWLHITGPEGVKPFIQAELGGAPKKEHSRNEMMSRR